MAPPGAARSGRPTRGRPAPISTFTLVIASIHRLLLPEGTPTAGESGRSTRCPLTNPKPRGGRNRGMSPSSNPNRCAQTEATCAYAAQALGASEIAAAEAHIAACPECQRELESLRPVVDRFVSWPIDVLRPTTSLQGRLALRIAEETGKEPVLPPAHRGEQPWSEPEWEQVAPGIE